MLMEHDCLPIPFGKMIKLDVDIGSSNSFGK
jgi:hypothetical protein